ncbi:MAG: pyridoxal phosphate-dependent aminotransferase, partial [Eubacteriales bacterium]|nr:pyridoxal phosphate-dependent aminotransferase [Eubacteriales bacterium]
MKRDLPLTLNQEALHNGQQRSVIRELFDYGQIKAKEIGAENIFDFSIGNPSIPPPPEVQAAFLTLLQDRDPTKLHGYTSSAGDIS